MKIKHVDKNKNNKHQIKKRTPRKISPTYLHNAGLYYLQRFSSSSENFKKIMIRKVRKSCAHHKDQDYEECCTMVDALVEKFIALDLLNDDLYTASKINTLRRQGKSERAILSNLRSKGLSAKQIQKHLERHNLEMADNSKDAEQMAALIFARKKRLGPFQGQKETPHEKALASLARAGFSYDIAQKTLKYSSEEAEELILHRK